MTETKKAAVSAIYPAMAKVTEGLANIPKNGRMKFGQTEYEYLRADDVQERLNPLLTENNIVVAAEYDVRDHERGNRAWVYVDLVLTYISTEDGSTFPPVRATGESVAGDDKSVNKALTQAIKNAHRATFQFASGETEPDDVKPSDTGAQRAVQTAKKPQSTQQVQQRANAAKGNSHQAIKDKYINNPDSKIELADVKVVIETVQKEGKSANKWQSGAEMYDEVLRRLEMTPA